MKWRTCLVLGKIIFLVTCIVWIPPVKGSSNKSPHRMIHVQNGEMTTTLKKVPLIDILRTLAEKTGIGFDLYTDLDREISAKYHRIPLEEGLRRLLRPSSYIIVYVSKNSPLKKADIKKIIVYDNLGADNRHLSKPQIVDNQKSRNRSITLNRKTEEGFTGKRLEDYVEQLNDTNPDVREVAIGDIVDKYEEAALVYLKEALVHDHAADVRATAAEEIGELDSEEGIVILAQGLADPDEDVRETVVEALGEIGGKRALPLLQWALIDESRDVRDSAAEFIMEIKNDDKEN